MSNTAVHTIRGTSDRFKVFDDAGSIIVRPLKGNGPVPMWSHDTLLNVAGGKLRRLVVVQGVSGNALCALTVPTSMRPCTSHNWPKP